MKALPFPLLPNVLVGLISWIAVILPLQYLLLGMVYLIHHETLEMDFHFQAFNIRNGNTFPFPNIEEQNGKHPLPPVQIQLSRRPMLLGRISSWCWEGREG